MIIGFVIWTVISLILIILVHHLFNFLKDTLTVPKVKDLVQQPTASYKDIEELISNESTTLLTSIPTSIPTSISTSIPTSKENDIDPTAMKNELKNFFKELKENKGKPEITSPNNFWPNKGGQNMYTEL